MGHLSVSIPIGRKDVKSGSSKPARKALGAVVSRSGDVKWHSVARHGHGILEGGLYPQANLHQRERMRAIAAERYGGPVVELEPVIEPLPEISRPGHPRERLPWMACMARLSSAPVDPELVSSELTLLWWQDAFELPLPQEIERAAADLDWAGRAEDVDQL